MHERQHAHTDTHARASTIMTFCFECEAVECSFHLFFPSVLHKGAHWNFFQTIAFQALPVPAWTLLPLVSGAQHWQSLHTLVLRLQQYKIQTHKRFRRMLFIRMKTQSAEKNVFFLTFYGFGSYFRMLAHSGSHSCFRFLQQYKQIRRIRELAFETLN